MSNATTRNIVGDGGHIEVEREYDERQREIHEAWQISQSVPSVKSNATRFLQDPDFAGIDSEADDDYSM